MIYWSLDNNNGHKFGFKSSKLQSIQELKEKIWKKQQNFEKMKKKIEFF